MNFLNKKYTTTHSHHHSHQSPNTRTYVQQQLTLRQHSIENYCELHPNEIIRHMCNQCVQMLCSQCIGDHLILHKQKNFFPTISTIKQVKNEMNLKIDSLLDYMNRQLEHNFDIEIEKKIIIEQIERLKKQITKVIEQWVGNFKISIIQNMNLQEISRSYQEMNKIKQEVYILKNLLANSNSSNALKKAYQLNEEKLYATFGIMAQKYEIAQKNSSRQFQINWKGLIKAFEDNIQVKVSQNYQSSNENNSVRSQVIQLPLENHQVNNINLKLKFIENDNQSNNLEEQNIKNQPIEIDIQDHLIQSQFVEK